MSFQVPDDYTEKWRRYRRLRNLFWLIWLTYVPAGYVVFKLLDFLHVTSEGIFYAFALIWMAGFAATGIWLGNLKCPKCGKRFSATKWFDWGFLARKCVHCGLRKYAVHP